MKKDYVWNLSSCNYKNGKYLASIVDGSAIMFDEVKEWYDKDKDVEAKSNDEAKSYDETKIIFKNLNEKKATCKTQNFYALLVFLLIAMALLIAVSIYYPLIKYRGKQLLPFYYTNNELLREVLY